jgi:hypothetical protein
MNKLSSITGRMLVGLALPMASTMGLAQTPSDLGRVDVSGSTAAQVVKFNVQQVCPQIAAELQANLEGMVRRFGERSAVRVDFKLSGNEVSAISAPFLPIGAALPIRRAVSGLSCEGTGGHSEHYAFLINFVNADSATGTSVATRQAPDQIASLTVLGR